MKTRPYDVTHSNQIEAIRAEQRRVIQDRVAAGRVDDDEIVAEIDGSLQRQRLALDRMDEWLDASEETPEDTEWLLKHFMRRIHDEGTFMAGLTRYLANK